MGWSDGVYSRGYASWTADANANLPISATKFDLEDNDFAAGLNNCITRDGLSNPSSALTWGLSAAQILTLIRGNDGTVLSVARVGGSNNPSLQFQVADSSKTVTINQTIAGVMALAIAGVPFLTSSATGNVDVPAPSAGTAFTINGSAGNTTALVVASGNSATNNNPDIFVTRAGSTANQVAQGPGLDLQDTTAVTATSFQHSGGQTELWQYNSSTWTQRMRITATGYLQTPDDGGTEQTVGWRDLPGTAIATNYTTVLADRGKAIGTTTSGLTATIAANASVAYPNGTVLTFFNRSAGNLLIAINSDNLIFAGTATTGTRTLAPTGIATAFKSNTTEWLISGAGLS